MFGPGAAPLACCAIHLAKRDNPAEQMEDAFAVCVERGRFAVADGVTESIFADVWARLLVEKFVAHPVSDSTQWNGWLDQARSDWWTGVRQRTLPWYAEHKLTTGAAATFVGLQVHNSGTWDSVAVGDACLFHLRDRRLLKAFPITDSESFGNQPPSVTSCTNSEGFPLLRIEGDWIPGDEFALTTDALAHWLLRENERDKTAWDALERLIAASRDPVQVAAELDALRDAHELRNDDVVLVVVQVLGSEY